MTIRGNRLLIGCGALVLAGIVALAVLEWDRRRQAAVAGTEILDGAGTSISAKDLEEQYGDPAAFARLCADVEERYHALQQRFLQLRHTRKTRQARYDTKGQIVAISEASYHVQFRNRTEQKHELERRQLMGKPSFFDPDTIKLEGIDIQLAPPFSKDSPEGLYRYHLEGVEELHGRRLLRVHFELTRPVERSFRGSAWIDPDTREPVRMQASLAKAKFSVDHFDMILDYGTSENGHNQLRRVVIDMAGGFALVSLHYRLESELSDYREVEK
jgi:hypothetical protein